MKAFLGPLLILDVSARTVPADDPAVVTFEGLILKEVPAILPIFQQLAHLQIEWSCTQKLLLALGPDTIYVIRMESMRKGGAGEACEIPSRPVRVE